MRNVYLYVNKYKLLLCDATKRINQSQKRGRIRVLTSRIALVAGVVQESPCKVAEAEAGGARSPAEAATGAASTQRRRRCRDNGDGERPFEPEQATTTEARTGYGQFRPRGSVVGVTTRRILFHRQTEEKEKEKMKGVFALSSTTGHVHT